MTVQQKIKDLFKFILYRAIVDDIYRHYNKSKKTFYTGDPMNVCITTTQLFKEMFQYGKTNGVSKVAILGYFKNRSNIYSLLADMRKNVFFSFTYETIEDYTEILGYNEYRRGQINFFRITPVKGSTYNNWKWIEIGKNCRAKIKLIYNTYRIRLPNNEVKEILR